MPSRLAERLVRARQRVFVGRADEVALFQSSVAAADLPFSVLYLFGPDGVGKTTLLNEFAAICDHLDAPSYLLNAAEIEVTPEAVLAALRTTLGLAPTQSPLDALAANDRRHVIMIDTYEAFAPLDRWVRDTFLPQLSEHALVVLASRNPPALGWRADPGWRSLIRITALQNLSPDESRAYLHARAVSADQHAAILDFTHGYPLALSLVADLFAQRPDMQFRPEAAPDVIRALLEQLVQQVPGPAHRAALEACAMVHGMTEALLGAMLAEPDVHALFDWLRGLSFMQSTAAGLQPHTTVREALSADLRWRNPDWYAELHRCARDFYTVRLQHGSLAQQQGALFDLVYLHRHNLVVRSFFEWQDDTSPTADIVRAGDWPLLSAMVERHEGTESAQLANFWFERQPESVLVARDDQGRPAGLLMLLALEKAAPDDIARDPATTTCWRYLAEHAPLRPGERATMFRFWMARDTYQTVSPLQSLIFVNTVRHYLATPGLAFTFSPCAEPAFWQLAFTYADQQRIEGADFTVGERRYGVFGHDWRAVPPAAWLALLADREMAIERNAAPTSVPLAPVAVLSQDAFAEAVRAALQQFARPDALRSNPLLRSRLVSERAGPAASEAQRAAVLRDLVAEACDVLQAAPRDAKAYRALHHTYIQPAPTQEQAAELLDLPFSTFRRHLKAGVERVTELLWQWEIQGR